MEIGCLLPAIIVAAVLQVSLLAYATLPTTTTMVYESIMLKHYAMLWVIKKVYLHELQLLIPVQNLILQPTMVLLGQVILKALRVLVLDGNALVFARIYNLPSFLHQNFV